MGKQLSQVLGGVMTATELAWCKHLPSQPLKAQDTVKMHPEKILRSYVDSFCEAEPHLERAGLNWPKWIVACVSVWKVTDVNQITQACMSTIVFLFR